MVGRTNNEMELKVKKKLGKVNDKNRTLRQGRRLKKIPKNFRWEAEHEMITLLAVPLIMY